MLAAQLPWRPFEGELRSCISVGFVFRYRRPDFSGTAPAAAS